MGPHKSGIALIERRDRSVKPFVGLPQFLFNKAAMTSKSTALVPYPIHTIHLIVFAPRRN